jgi:EEF1A lysine methyltransferase 4
MEIEPFEWLTSPALLEPILLHVLDVQATKAALGNIVLHVGSGRSCLGEHLLGDPRFNVAQVVNVDMEGDTLRQMEYRWNQRCKNNSQEIVVDRNKQQLFLHLNLELDRIDYPDGYFDLVLDKGTLDSTLCVDKAAASLLCQVHRLLKPETGVYCCVSFHNKDLMRTLLERLPGADWLEVQQFVVDRTVGPIDTNHHVDVRRVVRPPTFEQSDHDATMFRQTVNVFCCRRRRAADSTAYELCWDSVERHVIQVLDDWYKVQNPMVTMERENSIRTAIGDNDDNCASCALEDAFWKVIFTDAEREHLTYEHFLEDWTAFLEQRPHLPRDEMTFETAIEFLNEMQ